MTRKNLIVILAMLAVAASPGCNTSKYLLYLIAPDLSMRTVEAEFEGLENHSVAVVIFSDPAVQCDYPTAPLTLSTAVSAELQKKLESVTVLDPRRILKYQDENIHWSSQPKTALGKALQVDYVLFISLLEYTTREPGSVNLYRGRIVAEVSVYESASTRRMWVWRSDDIRVLYPPDAPLGLMSENDREVRYNTEKIFADTLVKKFHRHKVPK